MKMQEDEGPRAVKESQDSAAKAAPGKGTLPGKSCASCYRREGTRNRTNRFH